MNYPQLPPGYVAVKTVDLQKDKKLALLVNGLAVLLLLLMFFAANHFQPLSAALRFYFQHWWLFFVFAAAIVAYIVLHELVHGLFIRIFSGKKARYGFVGMYAFAGSDSYFDKRSYLIIALAPVVIWGLVLLALNLLLPREWFWFIYWLQIMNISGAAGDFYITWLMTRLPADVLTGDAGVSMIIYAKKDDA